MGGGGKKGGGGSGPDPRQLEAERQARVRAAVNAINNVMFNPSRLQEYNSIRNTAYQQNLERLERERMQAEQQIRNRLARQGLAGGTADVKLFDRLAQNYNDDVVKLRKFSDSLANQFKQADERSRLNLISQAQAGLDAGVAAQNALTSMQLNQQLARSQNALLPFGNLLQGINQGADTFQKGRGTLDANQALLSQLNQQNQWNSYYPPNSSGSFSGRETPIG